MGFLKKIFKPFKKVFKKIGKFVKRQFKRVGKWMGKLGVFGQVALMFIPGLGPMISGLFKGLGQGALSLLGKGLASANPLIKGASWLLDTARKVGGGIYKGFKTVTSAATSFIKNTTKYLANKIPGLQGKIAGAPDTFFSGSVANPGDSVLGRVGAEVSNNFKAFQDTVLGTVQADGGRVGGLFSGAAEREIALQDQLNITRIGGVDVDQRKLVMDENTTFDSPQTEQAFKDKFMADNEKLLGEINDGLYEQKGFQAAKNFQDFSDKMIQGFKDAGRANPFADTLNFIQAEPGYMNKLVNSSASQMEKWTESFNGGTDPFGALEFKGKTFGEKLRSTFQLPTPGQFAGKVATSTATNYLSSSLLAPSDPGPRFGLDNFANYRPQNFGLQQASYVDDLSQSMSGEGINGGYYGLGYVSQPTYA